MVVGDFVIEVCLRDGRVPGDRVWWWGCLGVSYGSGHVLVGLCDAGGGMPGGGEHVVWGLCGGSCFLTDQQPIAKIEKAGSGYKP